MSRLFTQRQRAVLYLRAKGICKRCGCMLNPANWHADHVIPYSHGGPLNYGTAKHFVQTATSPR